MSTQGITLEVHVQQGTRWTIHARYPASKKDAAIEEGKHLEKMPGITAVKVIKDVFDDASGVSHEFVVYASPAAKGGPARAAPAARATAQPAAKPTPAAGAQPPAPAPPRPAPPRAVRGSKESGKENSTSVGLLVRILLVLLISVLLAMGATRGAGSLLADINLFGVRMVGNAKENALLGVFIVTFLASAVVLAMTMLRGIQLGGARLRLAAGAFGGGVAMRARPRTTPAAPRPSAAQPPTAAALELASGGEAVRPPTPDVEQALDRPADESVEREKDEAAGPPEASEPPATAEEPEPEDALPPEVEKQRTYVMRFLGEALKHFDAGDKKLDRFQRFGINLFFAGACENLAQSRQVDEKGLARMLRDGMLTLGFEKSHAASFAERYPEYLMQDSRYMQMFHAGRNAMHAHFTDEKLIGEHMRQALAEWNRPKAKEAPAGPVTLFFTTVVDAAEVTQRLGDDAAQQAMRDHNQIVREALTHCNGKEIKHTGYGIMASFAKTSDALDAAIEIQTGAARHDGSDPELPLRIKIGINAGEPIVEDNDLYGTMVQLAARITDKAAAGEILCSELVHGICAGKGYNFVNRGGFPMKGFAEDQVLYEVAWREDAEAEGPAAPEAPQEQAPAPSARIEALPRQAPPRPAPSRPPQSPAPPTGGVSIPPKVVAG
jgi:adenylate cyclase